MNFTAKALLTLGEPTPLRTLSPHRFLTHVAVMRWRSALSVGGLLR